MVEAAASAEDRRPWQPWTQAWADALPLAPIWLGVALAAGHVASGALFTAAFVAPRPGQWWEIYREGLAAAVLFALLIGYGPTALAYARRSQRRCVRDLGPALRGSDAELRRLETEVASCSPAWLRAAGIATVAITVPLNLFTTEIGRRHELGDPVLTWVLWQNCLAFFLVARTIVQDVRASGRLSAAAERAATVDLLDLRPLEPLARRGLHSALVIILGLSIFSFVFAVGDVSGVVPLVQLAMVGVAGLALLLPSLGVHRRLRAAKRAELDAIGKRLAAARAAGPAAEARLADLLVVRQHLASAPEWPFDVPTLGRFALYAAIGVGSWFGGALVEHVVDALLR